MLAIENIDIEGESCQPKMEGPLVSCNSGMPIGDNKQPTAGV